MNIKEYIKNEIDNEFDGNLPFSTKDRNIKKGIVITDIGQFESNIYFLKKGIIQVEMESKNEIKILDFFFKESFFSSLSSLLNKTKSDVRIKAKTDCYLEVVKYIDLEKSYKNSLIANKLGRFEIEKLYSKRVMREKMILTENAESNYSELVRRYPEIVKNIPVQDIAKYLGIRPESLSRIRKRLIS